jgi:hypothetical protein
MCSLERVWRGVLALTIAGTIPLAIWGSGCDSQPLVQPDASGQSGGSPGTGGVASGGSPGSGGQIGGSGGAGGSGPRDASTDGPSPCCEGLSLATQCSADGRQLRTCFFSFTNATNKECSGGVAGVYAYVWSVQECANGCVEVDAGYTGTGGAPGTGGTGSGGTSGLGGNFGAGGSHGSGGSSPTGGYPGTSAKCQ